MCALLYPCLPACFHPSSATACLLSQPCLGPGPPLLLAPLLQRDPAQRPTPSEVLQHPWLCQAAPDRPLEQVVGRLVKLQAMNRVHRAAMVRAGGRAGGEGGGGGGVGAVGGWDGGMGRGGGVSE